MSISTVNPYLNHPQLSSLEQEVLWEYAKLGDKTKRIASLARETAANPNEDMLVELRQLEQKMGLVLTLFKSSVYGVLMLQQERQAEEGLQAQLEASQQQQQYHDDYSQSSAGY